GDAPPHRPADQRHPRRRSPADKWGQEDPKRRHPGGGVGGPPLPWGAPSPRRGPVAAHEHLNQPMPRSPGGGACGPSKAARGQGGAGHPFHTLRLGRLGCPAHQPRVVIPRYQIAARRAGLPLGYDRGFGSVGCRPASGRPGSLWPTVLPTTCRTVSNTCSGRSIMNVEITGLTRRFGRTTAVAGVDLRAGPGVFGLLGPNGAGKTSLL